MADLAAGDVTYTMIKRRNVNSKKYNLIKLVFGDGALTVPSGGIPLSKGKLGCPNAVESLIVFDQSTSGYKYQYDYVNEKLIVMQAPAQTHTHSLFLNNADVADGATTRINAGTNLLGANTGSDVTVAGVTSTSGAGGILQTTLAASAMSQASAVAIAAQTLYLEVRGW